MSIVSSTKISITVRNNGWGIFVIIDERANASVIRCKGNNNAPEIYAFNGTAISQSDVSFSGNTITISISSSAHYIVLADSTYAITAT